MAQDQEERPYFTFIESLTLIWSTLEAWIVKLWCVYTENIWISFTAALVLSELGPLVPRPADQRTASRLVHNTLRDAGDFPITLLLKASVTTVPGNCCC